MKKKILLVVPMLHQGGFERICIMTARLLQKEHEVTIVVFSLEDLAFDISGLSVIDLKIGAAKGRLAKIFRVLERGRRLTKLQKKLGIDVSYSFGITANIANALSRGAKRKITACHSFEEIKKSGYMKLISTHSDKVLCCAKKMAALAEEKYGFANTTALWNPCDIEEIQEKSQREEPEEAMRFFNTTDKVLVSMGREDDVKGFWHLLKIFAKVCEKEKNVRLAVIGDGKFTEYKELAEKLEIKDKVCFTGLKTNPFPYLKKAEMYLLTSLSEGLPNALVEAMALSVPIVSVNCLSGPAEILHENWQEAERKTEVFAADFGILTPVLSWEKDMTVEIGENGIKLTSAQEAMAEAIQRMLNDKELYAKYKEVARTRAAHFSKMEYLEKLKALLLLM